MASDSVTIILPPDPSPGLVDRLRSAFPDASLEPAAPAGQAPASMQSFEDALTQAVAGAAGFPQALATWWGGLEGGVGTLLLIILCLGAAYALERVLRSRWSGPESRGASDAPVVRRLGRGLAWFAWRLALVGVFAVTAWFLGMLLLPADGEVGSFARGVLGAILLARVLAAIIEALSAPQAPERRLMGFTDAEAELACRVGMRLVWIVGAVRVLQAVVAAAAPGVEGQLALVLLVLANSAVTAWFFLAVRRPVARLIQSATRPEGEATSSGRLASSWTAVFLLCIALDAVLKALGVLGLLGASARDGAGPALLVLVLAALAIAGLRAIREELGQEALGGWRIGLFAAAEGLVVVTGAITLLALWGIDPFDQAEATGLAGLLPALVEAGLVVVVGIALWRSIASALTRPPARAEGEDVGGEGIGGEGSRLETVLPILRGAALTAIGVTAAMTALAALGVNVTPLVASAGVVGLAIGFGAQKLVSDVISGAFYLYEDAFRLGEYIVTEKGKGAVERISIRSATLRHHRGPIYTIPFSEMGTVQNHSRDYVVMKFSFMVPEGTDLEMIRKLVKKAGQQLAQDPELEGKILAPLKSQGAIAIRGRDFEIGCKFTARPGEQFIIRRKAYAILQKTLRENDIELSAPAVTLAADDRTGAPVAKPI